MRKSGKLVLVILIILITVMATSAFVACKKKDAPPTAPDGSAVDQNTPSASISLTFVSNNEEIATKIDIDRAKEILASQPSREGYAFKGWYLDNDSWQKEVTSVNVEEIVKGDVSVYAYWIEIIDKITVRFLDYTGAELLKKDYERSDNQLSKDLASLRPSNYEDEQYTYAFDRWNCDVSDKTQDNYEATPVYASELRIFEINYYVKGELKFTDHVKYGNSVDLSKVEEYQATWYDDLFKHEFVEWSVVGETGNLNCVTQNITAYAVFNEIYVTRYTVQFLNWDGAVLQTVNVESGEEAVYSGETPTREPNEKYIYRFDGWTTSNQDADLQNVTCNFVATAQFKCIDLYTVVFINWEGSVLDTVKVEDGHQAVYNGETPTREPNEMYTYEFDGWTTGSEDANLENVTRNFVATANYNEVIRTYTITFTDDDDKVISTLADVPYGTDLRASTTFSIPSNEDAYMESTPKYDYTFIDWDQYLNRVYSDMTVKGIYKKSIRRYIVQFINNGSVISTQEIEYDQYPTLPAGNIFNGLKNETVKWNFTFFSWQVLDVDTTVDGEEGDIDADDGTDYRYTVENTDGLEVLNPENIQVHGVITYTAVYTRIIQQYVVKFLNEQGEQSALAEITVPYGTNMSERDDVPTASKTSDKKFHYHFSGWSQDLSKIDSNITVYAKYSKENIKYLVRFFNDEEKQEPLGEYEVFFGESTPTPDNPTKKSTMQYDFEFNGWKGGTLSCIEDHMDMIAVYSRYTRSYVVTLFNLATRELISTGEFAYGMKITTKINFNGYDFDSWYRDPNCDVIFNQEEECVDGPMMLFGNIVMKGLKFEEISVNVGSTLKPKYETQLAIVGYEGVEDAQINLILPMALNGKKVTTVKSKGLSTDSVTLNSIGSIYIPSTITSVEAYAFAGLVLTDTGGIYIQSPKKWYGTPDGWDQYWNRDSLFTWNEGNRPVTYGVDGVYSAGDFQYMFFEDGYAYVDRFINNTASNAFIPADVTYKLPSFTSTDWVDTGKTEETRKIYDVEYTEKTYNVTQIAVSAFENCSNLTSIYIPSTISKVGKYAFSGVTANVYIQMEQPKTLGIASDNPSGWSGDWNKNRDATLTEKGTGERTLHWGVIGFDRIGDFNYIFKTKGTAIVAEFLGNKATTTKIEIPGVVTYKDEEYKVEELVDELLADMTILTTVTLGENIKKIGKKAFANTSLIPKIMLTTVNLPESLEEIGEQAFLGNAALKQIYIPASVKKIGAGAFMGVSDDFIMYLGRDSKPLTGYALGWDSKMSLTQLAKLDLKNLGSIISTISDTHDKVWGVAGLPQTFTDGVTNSGKYTCMLYTDGHAELMSISASVLNTKYTLPSTLTYKGKEYTLTTIRENAFAGNKFITEVTIPTSVTIIGANAFQGCNTLLTINTDHTSAPSGWDANFNPDGRKVNYKAVETPASETTENTETEEVA